MWVRSPKVPSLLQSEHCSFGGPSARARCRKRLTGVSRRLSMELSHVLEGMSSDHVASAGPEVGDQLEEQRHTELTIPS